MAENRSRRLDELLSRIRMHGSTTIEELARTFDVSTATVRRDIKILEQEGAVVRTVGGGILAKNGTVGTAERDPRVSYIEEKIRIAEYCTELVEEHDEIIIGPGTTAFLVGRILTGIDDRRFRIIANSLELAMEASAVANIEAVILGGEVHNRHSAGFADRDDFFSSCHRNHKAIISADGIDVQQGLTLFDPRFLGVLRKTIAVSREIIVAADSSKIGKVCFDRIADISAVSMIVTDTGASGEFCRAVEAMGVTVVKV
jgi:DeoR/GlpR family transcriptional regulator of sugar metabolism